jgi:hypothetical protein
LTKTVIPPSPGGPRFDSLAPTLKRSSKPRDVPDATKRSLTVGVKKPTFKAARAILNILKVNNKVAKEKKTISLLDLPGETRSIVCSLANLEKEQLA